MQKRFESLAEFIEWMVSSQGEQEGAWGTRWFRGHPHSRLDLRPRMLRQSFVAALPCPPQDAEGDAPVEAVERAEQEINRQFRREAASLLPERCDLVEMYFLAQHHGLPTRLLDWTTNGLAALFFTAIHRPEDDGEVIVTSPTWQMTTDDEADPRVASLRESPLPQRHPRIAQAIGYLFGEGDRPEPPMILPILPDLRSPRMLQQGACFTLHLPGSGGIHESAVTRITIPRRRKPEFVRALRRLGITWSTLFPDLDHVCRELRTRWQDETEPY